MDRDGRPAWLLMAAGDDRGHGGNEGYDDQIDAYYSWDSNVPNARNLRPGDPIALWDKRRLLGVSVIETIESWPGTKQLNRCPACKTTRIATRVTKDPRYRCAKRGCHAEFDRPRVEVIDVELYRARYDAGWTSLAGLLHGAELQAMSRHPGDINAMRPISWSALEMALSRTNAERALYRVASRAPGNADRHSESFPVRLPDGFSRTVVRVRKGQSQFREHILAQQGNICAFTGDAPPRALEAGHLYSYAKLGEHHPHGGLMLRRDVHRLFDDGALAVDPELVRIDVGAELQHYSQYARLHGEPLTVDLRAEQVDWLGKHWDEHRAAMPTR